MTNKPWENEDLAKATVTLNRELYEGVKVRFHYGQLSKLFRNLFESIDDIIKSGKIMTVVDYIYKNKPLTLNPRKEKGKEDE